MATVRDVNLGTVRGVQKGATDQFLGIKYASLEHGFAVPQLKEDYGGEIDATKNGPTVVTTQMGLDQEFAIIQKSLEKPPFPGMSATEGLNLNITVPRGTKPTDRLPVVVFIHGGAFVFGNNYQPQIDFEKLVTLSVEIGKPIIGITINYRLGIHGFLDTQALRDAGFPANRGLIDQRVAFKWIGKHISAFGGDPKAITALGQSAGAVAVLLALYSSEELFQHAAALSGNPLMFPILPLPAAEFFASQAYTALGISDLPQDEQIQRLLAASPDELLTKVPPSIHMGTTLDGTTIGGVPTYPALAKLAEEVPGATWCKSLLVGSCDFDAQIYAFLGVFDGRGPLAQGFIERLQRAVPSDKRDKLDALFALYGLAPETPEEAARAAVIQLGSDLKFFSSSLAYARAWPGRAYLYQFKEANPWEGPFRGRATHVLDVALLFQTYNHALPAEAVEVARRFARDLVTFAHGEDPFPTLEAGKGGRVYGSQATEDYVPDVHALGPSAEVQKLWDEIGLQNLSQAWDLFLSRQ